MTVCHLQHCYVYVIMTIPDYRKNYSEITMPSREYSGGLSLFGVCSAILPKVIILGVIKNPNCFGGSVENDMVYK